MQALGLMADVVIVNLLIMVCSLPVVTAGAAIAAGHGTLLEMVREEGSRTVATFFRHFRSSWRTATVGWLLLLAVGAVLVWEYWALGRWDGGAAFAAQAAVVAGLILVGLWAAWFFPLASRGERFWPTAKLSALLGVGKLPRSIAAMVIMALPAILLLLNPTGWALWLAVMVILGLALVIYLVDLVVVGVLDRLDGRQPRDPMAEER